MTSSPSAPARPSHRRAVAVVVALCFGGLSSSLMQSLVIPIQSKLPELLSTTASTSSWVVTATLLGGAVSMPITGRLADLYGKKPILVVSAVLMLLGSLTCAVSSEVSVVLTGRVLQGTAMGYIPVAISMVREAAPPRLRNTAVAGVSATLGVGGALGLPLSAWIAQDYDWHLLFWTSAGLAAVMIILTVLVVPHVRDTHPARLDVLGALGLAAGLVGLLVGVSKGNDWGWTNPSTLGLIAAGVVVLVLWGAYELHRRDPLVDLRTSARKPILLTNLAAVLVGFGMMAQSIVAPQLLQVPTAAGGMGQTILQAGLWLTPGGLMMVAFTPVSSRMLTAFGGRVTLATGASVLAAGYVVAIFLMGAPWQVMLFSAVVCAGVGIGYAAMPTLILTNVPAAESAASVGVNSLMRSVGTTVAGAVMAVVLTSNTVVPVAGALPVPTQSAYRLCFIIGALAAAAGALIVLLIPRRRRGAHGDVRDDVEADAADALATVTR